MIATESTLNAPDFLLPSHTGGMIRLSESLGQRATILVFFRGHWCPYCRRYLGKVQSAWPRFTERGARVLAISPETPATSAGFARELGIGFPLLSDLDCGVIERYGVRNNFTGATPFLPHPAVFILNAAREIVFRSVDRNYKRRTPIPAYFRVLEEMAK